MKLRKIILGMLSNFFCSGDIKLSVMVVLGSNTSHVGSNTSQMGSNTSQKRFLCKCKPTARDFGKRFRRWINFGRRSVKIKKGLFRVNKPFF